MTHVFIGVDVLPYALRERIAQCATAKRKVVVDVRLFEFEFRGQRCVGRNFALLRAELVAVEDLKADFLPLIDEGLPHVFDREIEDRPNPLALEGVVRRVAWPVSL